MDELLELWPSLTHAQQVTLLQVARAFLFAEPEGKTELLSAAQACEEFNVPTSTLYAAAQRGELRCVTPNGMSRCKRFQRKDVMAWLGL